MVHGNMLSFVRKKSVSQMLKFLCLFSPVTTSITSSLVHLSFSFLICCIFYPNKILEHLEKINSFERIILDFYYKHSRQEAKGSKTQKTIKESRAESPISFASDNFIFRLIFLISQFCLFEEVANIL